MVEQSFGDLYSASEQAELPEEALLASLDAATRWRSPSCGQGERVLDLGSGAASTFLLSARRVGPTGRAFGVDMTDDALDLARRTSRPPARPMWCSSRTIESIPLPAESIDVVISNCVINLSVDKPAVLGEMFRVWRAVAGSASRCGGGRPRVTGRAGPSEGAMSGASPGR